MAILLIMETFDLKKTTNHRCVWWSMLFNLCLDCFHGQGL